VNRWSAPWPVGLAGIGRSIRVSSARGARHARQRIAVYQPQDTLTAQRSIGDSAAIQIALSSRHRFPAMDRLSPQQRSFIMSRIRGKDTQPELAVRRMLHRLGFRYRLHVRDLPGTPDLVFHSRRKIVFVHGCFWHCHSRCGIAGVPTSNRDYWLPKLKRTRQRDLQNSAKLRRLGWKVLVVWECELSDATKLAARLVRFLCAQ
jgi:DNA mismatch endonuclease (patch repair protein)